MMETKGGKTLYDRCLSQLRFSIDSFISPNAPMLEYKKTIGTTKGTMIARAFSFLIPHSHTYHDNKAPAHRPRGNRKRKEAAQCPARADGDNVSFRRAAPICVRTGIKRLPEKRNETTERKNECYIVSPVMSRAIALTLLTRHCSSVFV